MATVEADSGRSVPMSPLCILSHLWKRPGVPPHPQDRSPELCCRCSAAPHLPLRSLLWPLHPSPWPVSHQGGTLPAAQGWRWQHGGWEEAEKEAAPARFTQSCQVDAAQARTNQPTPTSSTSTGNVVSSSQETALAGHAEPLSTFQGTG